MKVLTVVGARPQFIKAAPVSQAFARAGIEEKILHTGQHYDFEMSEVFFRELEIPRPQYNLGLGGGTHGVMTGRMLEAIEEILLAERPDWLLVYGDTNSTLAGALAASKLQIPICHVESGLRSLNRAMPEEINRVLTDHLSTRLFCSSDVGVENLKREGIRVGVEMVGDVMADASGLARTVTEGRIGEFLTEVDPSWLESEFSVMTLHRAENTDDPCRLRRLVEEINTLEHRVVFPIHPRTSQAMKRDGISFGDHVSVVGPVGYLEMASLLSAAALMLTDSGGLQKEAYWAKVPCVTLRTETEWVETVEQGWNVIYGEGVVGLRGCIAALKQRLEWVPLYGNGGAAVQIVDALGRTGPRDVESCS